MATSTLTNDKLYGHFTPTERLTLTLEAMARGDKDEAMRLRQSCPVRVYEFGDLAYNGPREFIWELAVIVAGDLGTMNAKLTIFASLGEMAPYLTSSHAMAAEFSFMAGWRLGQGLSPLPSPPMEVGDDEGDYLDVDLYLDEARKGTGVSVFADPETEKLDWEPTPKQRAELDAWDAPKEWVELANRRMAGLTGQSCAGSSARCWACGRRGTASAGRGLEWTATPGCGPTRRGWRSA